MEKLVKFEFSIEQVNMILTALGNLPYVQSAPIIGYIQQIALQQIEESKDEDTAEPTDTNEESVRGGQA